MALRKLVRINYGGKSPVSIKHKSLHSFKEGVILLCQSILETRRISHLHGSALFTIPLSTYELLLPPGIKGLNFKIYSEMFTLFFSIAYGTYAYLYREP